LSYENSQCQHLPLRIVWPRRACRIRGEAAPMLRAHDGQNLRGDGPPRRRYRKGGERSPRAGSPVSKSRAEPRFHQPDHAQLQFSGRIRRNSHGFRVSRGPANSHEVTSERIAGIPAEVRLRRPRRTNYSITCGDLSEKCAQRRFGVSSATSLARSLAIPTSIPRRRAAGKGEQPTPPATGLGSGGSACGLLLAPMAWASESRLLGETARGLRDARQSPYILVSVRPPQPAARLGEGCGGS